MNKKELVSVLSERLGLSIRKTIVVLDTVLDSIFEYAVKEGRCFCGSHKFKLRKLAERRGRNPNTGDKLVIPPKTIVTYRKAVAA